jgi:type IV secretory pathway TraG/TraD family ATPase VirD4
MLGKTVVANPPRRSVMVIAPTGAGKTPRVAVPRVLEHTGPALVTSVKADILHLTRHHRATRGPVWVFDITGVSGLPSCRWSPLAGVHSYADAMKAAAWISESSKIDSKGVENQRFWDTLGDKLLAPLLFAAARTGRHICDVVRWVDLGSEREVQTILDRLGDPHASAAWTATCARVDRTKASVFGTAEVVLQPFSHPEVGDTLTVDPGAVEVFSPAQLVDSGGTLYLVAPAHDQELFTPVFETLTNAVLREVELRSARNQGLPIDPPLLVCLDEAANCAPLRRLDRVASAGANQGIKLASFWQDEGQIVKVYGPERARTVISNHTTRIFLPGVSDDQTLRSLSEAIGDHRVRQVTTSHPAGLATRVSTSGRRSTSTSYTDQRLAPVAWLRNQPEGTAIVLTGRVKPMRLTVPGWWEQPQLARLMALTEIPQSCSAKFPTLGACQRSG